MRSGPDMIIGTFFARASTSFSWRRGQSAAVFLNRHATPGLATDLTKDRFSVTIVATSGDCVCDEGRGEPA